MVAASLAVTLSASCGVCVRRKRGEGMPERGGHRSLCAGDLGRSRAKPQIWAPSILQRNGSGSQWAPPAKLFLVSAFGRAPVGARAEAAFGALPKGALISGVVKA